MTEESAVDLVKKMAAVLRRAGWNYDVAFWAGMDGIVCAELLRTEQGKMEYTDYILYGEGLDKESASRDLLRNWAAGKGPVPAASSPEELEFKIAVLNLNGKATCVS